MTAAVEIINGETGEVLRNPARAPFGKKVSSLRGLFAKARAQATGPVETAGLVAFSEGGRRLHARWSGDCLNPRSLQLSEYPDRTGVVARAAMLRMRCKRCDPCRDALRRKRQWAAKAETLIGAFRSEAAGAPPGVPAHLVPGFRTWMVTDTFNGDERQRLKVMAAAMKADAERRCEEASGEGQAGVSSGDSLGRRLSGLMRKGPAPSEREGDPRHAEREAEARKRRFGLVHDNPSAEERYWWFRAAHRYGSAYLRRVRASRPRSEGQIPLRAVIVVEGHKRDGFPHLHILIHEQGVAVEKRTLVRCWSRRRDGAPSGGLDPAADLVPLGACTAKLAGGHRVVLGQKVPQKIAGAAYYVAKYVAKEGVLWRASKGYGSCDDERLQAFATLATPEAEHFRCGIRRARALELVDAAIEAAEELEAEAEGGEGEAEAPLSELTSSAGPPPSRAGPGPAPAGA